jgi:hypothetical protein
MEADVSASRPRPDRPVAACRDKAWLFGHPGPRVDDRRGESQATLDELGSRRLAGKADAVKEAIRSPEARAARGGRGTTAVGMMVITPALPRAHGSSCHEARLTVAVCGKPSRLNRHQKISVSLATAVVYSGGHPDTDICHRPARPRCRERDRADGASPISGGSPGRRGVRVSGLDAGRQGRHA